ncbi:MAG: DUF364 domain-containing protein [Firmicutes bacterium]|nr:DUF364 domain-containing protein [Bacillota bacterium]
MKSLYDRLIEGIPDNLEVDDVVCAHYGAMVYSNGSIGLSEFRDEFDTRPMLESGNKLNMSLKQLASGIKSWNITEASMGHAAINAYYNSPEMAEKNGIVLTDSLHSEDRNADPFITYQKEVAGKKVVVVGHFPYLEQLFGPICDLHIIENYPYMGDYPEQATEYLIPGCDFAFIGALTIVDKRLPRLLELAKDAFVGIVGPVTIMSPILFEYGVDELDGIVIKDPKIAERVTKEQEIMKIYASGQKVSLRKTEYEAFKAKG